MEETTGHEISLTASQLQQMRDFLESADFPVAGVKLVGRTDGYVEMLLAKRGEDGWQAGDGRGRMLFPV
jgi:hypothetical protein